MNILIIHNYLVAGGLETAVQNEAKLLTDKNHKVAILCFDSLKLIDKTILADSNIKFYSPYFIPSEHNSSGISKTLYLLKYRLINYIPIIRTLLMNKLFKEIFHSFKPDIIHNHVIGKHLYKATLCNSNLISKIPIVYTSHFSGIVCPSAKLVKGTDDSTSDFCEGICSAHNDLGKSALKYNCLGTSGIVARKLLLNGFKDSFKLLQQNVNIVTAPSKALTRLIKASGQLPEKNIYTMNNPLSMSFFNKPLNVNKNKSYILFSGRLVEEKGCQLIIEAMCDLDLPLYIVGDGPYREDLEQLARDKELKNIKFLGWKSGKELEEIYRNAYAFIVPSVWFENYPVTIQEAFSHAIPVIGSINGGIPELVINNETGLLFERNNVEQLKECIIQLWDNPELTQKLGKNAYDFLHNNHHPDVIYPQLMAIFEKAIEEHKSKQHCSLNS